MKTKTNNTVKIDLSKIKNQKISEIKSSKEILYEKVIKIEEELKSINKRLDKLLGEEND